MKPPTKIRDWNHFFYVNPRTRKGDVAMALSVHPAFFSKLLDPERYQPLVPGDLVDQIAALWNQEPSYVRKLYPRAA